jgi:alpha-tubulin suppressor-like RCC1 family protein
VWALVCASGLALSSAPAQAAGSVFSFGSNVVGRTGLGTEVDSTLVPTAIDPTHLAGLGMTQVAAAGGGMLGRGMHSLLLAEDGTVFSYGRTGLGTLSGTTTVAAPILTTHLDGLAITQVATGGAHSLILAEDGRVFSFGAGGAGQTGYGTTDNALVAQQNTVGSFGPLFDVRLTATAMVTPNSAIDIRAFVGELGGGQVDLHEAAGRLDPACHLERGG